MKPLLMAFIMYMDDVIYTSAPVTVSFINHRVTETTLHCHIM